MGLESRRIWVWISVLQLLASAALVCFSKLGSLMFVAVKDQLPETLWPLEVTG